MPSVFTQKLYVVIFLQDGVKIKRGFSKFKAAKNYVKNEVKKVEEGCSYSSKKEKRIAFKKRAQDYEIRIVFGIDTKQTIYKICSANDCTFGDVFYVTNDKEAWETKMKVKFNEILHSHWILIVDPGQ